jgi:hypothetical protein
MDRRKATVAACFWINKLDKVKQWLPGQHLIYLIHLGQKFFFLGALFCAALFSVSKFQLLAFHHPSSCF